MSEASVYRLLKDQGLIASPAFILMKAADRFANPTTAPNQLWQTDFTYLKVIGWGWFYPVHRARRLLALHPGLEALHDHVGRGCVGYVHCAEGVWLGLGQGSTSAAAAER